jgi:hypothetical protein
MSDGDDGRKKSAATKKFTNSYAAIGIAITELNIKFYTASSFKLHFKTLEARGVHIY